MLKPTRPTLRGWRFPLSVGLSIGLAIGVTRGLRQNIDPLLGAWAGLALSLVAAAIIGSLVSLSIYRLVWPEPDESRT